MDEQSDYYRVFVVWGFKMNNIYKCKQMKIKMKQNYDLNYLNF